MFFGGGLVGGGFCGGGGGGVFKFQIVAYIRYYKRPVCGGTAAHGRAHGRAHIGPHISSSLPAPVIYAIGVQENVQTRVCEKISVNASYVEVRRSL